MITVLLTIAALGLVGTLGVIAARAAIPYLAAQRERVVADPLDHVRSWMVRVTPRRLKAQQRVAAARAAADTAATREARLLATFKDGKEPAFPYTVTILTLFVLWIISILGAFLIDLPIIVAVSGGNALFGVVGAVLLLGIPIIGSVLLGHFFAKRKAGDLSHRAFVVITGVILTLAAVVVGILMVLAPIRADVEYGEKIRVAEQQLVVYGEEGDQSALAFTQQNLDDLRAQRDRSAEWNRALVPIAATAEFATGFFFPLAMTLLLFFDAQKARAKAERGVVVAQNAVINESARQYARLSASFRRRGVGQDALAAHMATVNRENLRQAAAPEVAAPAPLAPAPTPGAPAAPVVGPPAPRPADEAITAEIVETGDLGMPRPPRPRTTAPTRFPAPPTRPDARPAPAEATPRVEAAEPDAPDDSFDLS